MKRFNRLQWKLTISYMLTSVVVLCLLELLVMLIGLVVSNTQGQARLESHAQNLAQMVGSTLSVDKIGQQRLQAIWKMSHDSDATFQGYLAAIDGHGRVSVAAGDVAPAAGSPLLPQLPASVQQILATDPASPLPEGQRAHTIFVQDNVYVVTPLLEGEKSRGALVVRIYVGSRALWMDLFLFFGVRAVVFFIGAGMVGLAFGIVTARGLVRRLQTIVSAVDGWSQGDFSLFVQDASRDELGQLARRLNQMAQQLQQLLRTRQDLATVEERQRLARDLHDSVKQQVFAVSLHVSTTRALMERNPTAAQTQLAKAENLIRQAQRELTTLIRELRPVGLEGKNLAEAVRQYTRIWQEQTGIPLELEMANDASVPLVIENALFRIIQEGLSNVERHSEATAVRIQLTCTDRIKLAITDNGRGFDGQRKDYRGVGLSSMRERIQALNGQIEIQSEPGKGTTITVSCEQPGEEIV
ncbi:hypothetical protein KDA_71020 [Dictyobacter alpinus]|uniref:Oxygen sensor histidine kinase NreB n=1 Tax=Dictyobacter alpinus TaxID=2014873 RepID=A0A402BJT7_9CHLR|nr:hypothetical protein KDA_71020 [Dictyobacter alpinus]